MANSPEESQGKPIKKSASVKFAPEISSITSIGQISGADQENFSPNKKNANIKNEICSILPSNTLHRRHKSIFTPAADRAHTVPRTSMHQRDTAFSMSGLHHLSCAPLRKKGIILPSEIKATVSDSVTQAQEASEEYEVPLTEEEKLHELKNIRNLPIRMEEKRMYRDAIFRTMVTSRTSSSSWKSKVQTKFESWLKNLSEKFDIWTKTFKRIEGQFGTGVVSYFVFLRWLILLNLFIFILFFSFTVLPQAAFSLLKQRRINVAPNATVIDEHFLKRFSNLKDVKSETKNIKNFGNVSVDISKDLWESLGILLDHYAPEEILDVTIYYDKRNLTFEERQNISLYCETKYLHDIQNNSVVFGDLLQDFLQGTGWLESTVLFLGFYPSREVLFFGYSYNMALAFLSVLMASFILCLLMMVQYTSHGIHENLLSRKNTYLTYSNILFCSWDFCIEDKKNAIIRHKSIVNEIKSNLAEERRKIEVKQWSTSQKLKLYMLRIFVNVLVLMSLFASYYFIYIVVTFQLEELRQNRLNTPGIYTLFVQFLSPLVITALNILMPIIFYNLVKFEMYNTRTQINMALVRIVFLRLSSLIVLVSSLYQQITCEPKDMCRAGLSVNCRSPLCWETYVGQQLYKLAITDFFVYVIMYITYDLPRDFIVQRYRNKVTAMIGRQVFDLPSQVLSLVYSQTICWLGLFYSPLLPAITVMKFGIVFYIKRNIVLKHCIPAPIAYKASRSNAMFMTILMISFFVVTLIHGYSLSSIEPSPGCSPFRFYFTMVSAIPDVLYRWSPHLTSFLSFLFSPFFFIPSFFLLSIAIYYYWTVMVAHRKMVKVLKAQIVLEGRDKQFLLDRLVEGAKQVTD